MGGVLKMVKDEKIDPLKVLVVKHKFGYGKDFFYPQNPTGLALAKVAKCDSFTKDQLEVLVKELGYHLELAAPEGIEDLIGKGKK